MTVAYLDASALVKLLVAEPGSDVVAMLWDGADVVAASRVAHAEVTAAIAAAARDQRLPDVRAVRASWDELRVALRWVELTPAISEAAAELAVTHRLSGFDAIHLASALVLGPSVVVATWDRRLHDAAGASGLRRVPETIGTG